MRRDLWAFFGVCLGSIACLSLALSSTRRNAIQPVAPQEKTDLDSLTVPGHVLLAEVIVKEIRIAESQDFIDLHAKYPHKWERYVVTFEVTKVLKGRFDRPEIKVLVHSPSSDLHVREEGQRGRISANDSSGPYEFMAAKG
jgi:hypothetical protein